MRNWIWLLSSLILPFSSKLFALETGNPHAELAALLANPNVVYILLLIAIYGLFFEFSSPGLALPGIMGALALLLVIYALSLLPVNNIALFILFFGSACMLLEMYVSSYGIVGFCGLIAFILGSVMLFDPPLAISTPLLIGMSTISIIFFAMMMLLAFRSQQKKIITGQEGLIGSEGIVLNARNQRLTVRVLGEIWEATSTSSLNMGEKVKVTQVKGLVLSVVPFKESGAT